MTATLEWYQPSDHDEVIAVLMAAFEEDPVFAQVWGDKVKAKESAFHVMLQYHWEETHVLKDEGVVVGAIVWGDKDYSIKEEISTLWAEVKKVGPSSAWSTLCAYASVMGIIDTLQKHKKGRRYLKVVGVSSAHQGKGYGSTMINESCKLMAASNTSLKEFYLESSNLRNVPFYERNGFVNVERKTWRGCTLTAMVREE